MITRPSKVDNWNVKFSRSQVIFIQNRKVKRLNYTLIAFRWLIMGEYLKTVAYLKNQTLSQKKVTLYEMTNRKKPNFRQLYVISLKTWIHVPEK